MLKNRPSVGTRMEAGRPLLRLQHSLSQRWDGRTGGSSVDGTNRSDSESLLKKEAPHGCGV